MISNLGLGCAQYKSDPVACSADSTLHSVPRNRYSDSCRWHFLWIALLLPELSLAQAPDLIIHNAKIITVDDSFSVKQAMAVKGDRIVRIGGNQDVLKVAADSTKVIDLKNATVIPGLIDSHVHSTGAATYEFDHPVPDMQRIDDVLEYIKSRAAKANPGEWIRVQQVFITRLREQRFPTRQELDRAAPRNPVDFRTGPDSALNSLALAESGIDRNTKLAAGASGKIEKDAAGEPTGILRGARHLIKFKSNQKSPTSAQRLKLLRQLHADYNAVGITSISDRNASDSAVRLYEQLLDRDQLNCRVFLYYSVNANSSPKALQDRIKKAAGHKLHQYNNRLWLRGIKVFLDGGMLTGSAYMREPWGVSKIYSITDPKYRGTLKIQPERLYQIAKLAMENELQMTAHSVGDGAVHALIDAYEQVNERIPVRKHRPCITHCNFMSLEAIQKMKALGIVADLQPAWLLLDGATLVKQFGNERTKYFQPYRSLFDHKVVIGGGSDHMQKIGSLRSINPYNPFLGMWVTLTRQPRWTEDTLHAEQRITRQEALRLYTINNAFLTFEEKQKGSLERGKLADFVILDRDIITCPVDQVKDIRPIATYVGGKEVYRK